MESTLVVAARDVFLDCIVNGARAAVADLIAPFCTQTPAAAGALTRDFLHAVRHLPGPLLSGQTLAAIGATFHHKAGTLTDAIDEALQSLAHGAARLRMAHQANLFPAISLIEQLLALPMVATEVPNSVLLYIIVDYDTADDERFRVATLPDMFRRRGRLTLEGAVAAHYAPVLMSDVPAPSRDLVADWLDSVRDSLRAHLRWLSRYASQRPSFATYQRRYDALVEIVWASLERATTLVEFNAFILNRVVQRIQRQPIVFIPGTLVHQNAWAGHELVVERWDEIAAATEETLARLAGLGVALRGRYAATSPLWLHCTCGLRMATSIDRGLLQARCASCGRTYERERRDAALDNPFIPRVIADNLLDWPLLGIVGGSGYIGQAEHLLVSSGVAALLGWPLPPQFLTPARSRPRGYLGTIRDTVAQGQLPSPPWLDAAHELAANGRASLLYQLLNTDI